MSDLLAPSGEEPSGSQEVAAAPAAPDGREGAEQTAPAATGPGLPAWYRKGRRFILCLEGDSFPQTSPEIWAQAFARKLKRPVVIRDAESFEALATISHERPKAPKAPRAPRQPSQNGRPAALDGFNLDAIVTVLAKENPKRAGSDSARRFELWKPGRPLRESLEAGVTAADARWDLKHGFIRLDAAGA